MNSAGAEHDQKTGQEVNMPDWQRRLIQHLHPHEVLVFGSNSGGYHGTGVAGLAFRGNPDRNYETDPFFQQAKSSPVGHPNRIGNWAVFGASRGYQEGRRGASYAIETLQSFKPRISTPPREIYRQLQVLRQHALAHPGLTYLITPIGTGYAGYTEDQMNLVWKTLEEREGFPVNFVFCRP